MREYGAALWHTLRIARRLSRDEPFDVVHACNPPDLLFLIALALRPSGARFLFDHHDLVPELFESRFAGGPRVLHRVSVLLERSTFRPSDAVISTNESYRQVAIDARRAAAGPGARGAQRPRPRALRPGRARPRAAARQALPRLLPRRDGPPGRRRLRAARARPPARRAGPRRPAHDVHRERRRLRRVGRPGQRASASTDVVEFTGRVPDETVQAYLSTADVCLSPDPKNPLNDVSSMNKVVEYMAMGRPLVSFELHEARVTAAGRGRLRARQRRARVRGADRRAARRPRAARADGGDRPAPACEEALSWDVSRRNLLAAYEDLVARPLRRRERRRRGPLARLRRRSLVSAAR